MAEFCEVMKQAQRMCESHGNDCTGCALHKEDYVCPFDNLPDTVDLREMAEVERIVMDWAAKNPEPKYPTWNQWWKNTFPDAAKHFLPCKGYFMGLGERHKVCRIPCEVCNNQPIPADIAEKLGVKPIGGSTDEKA